jgi:hypothetical protein
VPSSPPRGPRPLPPGVAAQPLLHTLYPLLAPTTQESVGPMFTQATAHPLGPPLCAGWAVLTSGLHQAARSTLLSQNPR